MCFRAVFCGLLLVQFSGEVLLCFQAAARPTDRYDETRRLHRLLFRVLTKKKGTCSSLLYHLRILFTHNRTKCISRGAVGVNSGALRPALNEVSVLS